jgi:hypothetical protein
MIDPATGAVSFEEPAIVIAPHLTRSAFAATPWGAAAEHWVINEPWHSWKLAELGLSAGIRFVVVLYFHHERLLKVELCNADPAFGTSWEDHSREKEDARDASHQAWLATFVGERRVFDWGDIWAGYDDRGGFSGISIRYGKQTG